MASALTPKVVSRFAACLGWSVNDTLQSIVSMSPEQRSAIAVRYQTDDLLSDDQKIVADSMRIRLKLAEMQSRRRTTPRETHRGYSAFCPLHGELSPTDRNPGSPCTCYDETEA